MIKLKTLLLFLFSLSACFSNEVQQNTQGFLFGRVVGVSDGDTVKVLDENKTVHKIRLADIDCPELKGQAFGNAAKQFTSDLVFGKEVKVDISKGKDRYGRWIGTVYINDLNLNRELVANGFAWVYRYYYKGEELINLEQKAKQQKLGLWKGQNPIAPWEFRRLKK